MAIDKETNKTVGGGGGIDIESTNQSIIITEPEPGKKDLSVNWGDMPATGITSPDSSVDVTETAKNTFELSVPLATEKRKGLLSPVGKYQLDHSQLIQTETATDTANDSAVALILQDEEYTPVDGQMMTWTGTDGKLHLSRYEITGDTQPLPSRWWRFAVTDKHGTTFVLSKAGIADQSIAGKFLIARTKDNGKYWDVFYDANSPTENWGDLFYFADDDILIALARNSASQFFISYDGGDTWASKSMSSGAQYYFNIWRDWANRYVFAYRHDLSDAEIKLVATTDFSTFTDVSSDYPAKTKYCFQMSNDDWETSNRDNNWFCLCNITGFIGEQSGLFVKRSGNWVQYEQIPYPSKSYDTATLYLIYNPSNQSYRRGWMYYEKDMRNPSGYYLHTRNIYGTLVFPTDINFFIPISLDNSKNLVGVVGLNDGLYKAVGTFPISGGPVMETAGDPMWDGEFVNQCQTAAGFFAVGGTKHDGLGRKSDFNMFFAVSAGKIVNVPIDYWREIPLLPEHKTGVAVQTDNTAEIAQLGDFLKLTETAEGKELGTIHSDRITPFANYKLESTSGNICWCPVAPADIVDNTTKIYSDEDCTDEIGVVIQHSFNPSNPNDVEVSIGGETEVYVIDPTKIPQSLATTAALLAAIDEVKKKVPVAKAVWYIHNGVPSQVTGITYNNNTGFFEKTINNNVNDQVVTTIDDQPPALDYSNMLMLYTCVQVSGTFTTYVACVYTDGTRTAPLFLTV